MEKGIVIAEMKRHIDFMIKESPNDVCVFISPELYNDAVKYIEARGYMIDHVESCPADGRVAVFLKEKKAPASDWNKFRTETAASIMQTMIASKHWEEQMLLLTEESLKKGKVVDPCSMYADAAINFTEALIMKLKEKEEAHNADLLQEKGHKH